MAATMNAATFMGKNFSTIQNFNMNFEDLSLKQMFDVTAQLVNDQEEIHAWFGQNSLGKEFLESLSLIGDKTVINLQAQKSMSSRILCCASGGSFNILIPTKLGRTELQGSRPRKATEILMVSTESRLNSSGTSSQDSQRCSSVVKINDLLSDLGQTPETFTGRISFMSMSNDISCDRKGNKEECLANAGVVKVLARKFGVGQWSFIGPGSEKKWYSAENNPQGAWDHIADEMLLEFAESGHPTFRATTPLSRGILKSKGHGKLSIHFAADELTIETIFRIRISVNQLSIYGAVAAICVEFQNHQDGTGQLEILIGSINCSR